MKTDLKGVLYIATGIKHIKAANRSARSVREHNPVLPIHLYVDQPEVCHELMKNLQPFTIGLITDPHPRSKVDYLGLTPFEQTLYLDTDTRVLDTLDDIFILLDRFDIALAHAQARNRPLTVKPWTTPLPYSFPQFNSGVIAYRRNDAVLNFFNQWRNAFHSVGFSKDQITLRELLWTSNLRIATLPPEYNIRYRKYLYVWRKDEAIPKIFHLEEYKEERFGFLKRLLIKLARRTLRFLRGLKTH